MAAKKKARAKRSPAKKMAATGSAKRPGRPPKKAAVIDAILKENPSLSAGEVRDKAKEQRTNVSLQSIYNNATWKSLHANGAARPAKGSAKRTTTNRSTSANGVQADFTRSVKKLGIAKARELLEIIAAYENA